MGPPVKGDTGALDPAPTFREQMAAQDQALADKVARLVLDQLQPGLGPMLLPEWAVDVLRDAGRNGGYIVQFPLYHGGAAAILLQSRIQPDGSLFLSLEINGQPRVWEGVLRGPGPREPGCRGT